MSSVYCPRVNETDGRRRGRPDFGTTAGFAGRAADTRKSFYPLQLSANEYAGFAVDMRNSLSYRLSARREPRTLLRREVLRLSRDDGRLIVGGPLVYNQPDGSSAVGSRAAGTN